MYKIRVIDEGTKEDLYWGKEYRTKIGARKAIIAVAKIDVQRTTYPDFPMFCWFKRKTEGKLYMNCGNITWRIEKA